MESLYCHDDSDDSQQNLLLSICGVNLLRSNSGSKFEFSSMSQVFDLALEGNDTTGVENWTTIKKISEVHVEHFLMLCDIVPCKVDLTIG